MQLRRVSRRVYTDFLMPSRLGEYRELLCLALELGYQICSISGFYKKVRTAGIQPGQKYLVLRHDVDSDVGMARLQWKVESELGIQSSYFFRLRTMQPGLVREIHLAGSDASYHYEELATVAKELCLANRDQVLDVLPDIRVRFRRNLTMTRLTTALPMTIVAAHGDWINRRLGVASTEILQDRVLREDLGIELEAYDAEYLQHVDIRITDAHGDLTWWPEDPVQVMQKGMRVIELLVHPGQWRANLWVNILRDSDRVLEGARYRLGWPLRLRGGRRRLPRGAPR